MRTVAIYRTLPTILYYSSRNRYQMIPQVCIMNILFKIVSAGIRNYFGREDVKFAHAPGIKTRLRKKTVQQPRIPDLDIPDAEPKPMNTIPLRNGTKVITGQNPS